MKPETKFRVNLVDPFLKTLKNCTSFSIQQVSINGDPDKMLCLNGRFVGLELKDVGEKPRKLQVFKLDQIDRTNGVALVADRDNWNETKEILSYMDATKENAWKQRTPLKIKKLLEKELESFSSTKT